jgi:predicted CoA-binding protein
MRLNVIDAAGEACEVPAPGDGDALDYDDEELVRIYRTVRTVAMVGASPNWNRPSYFVMKYLQRKGYRVIPVNPMAAGQQILGETAVADLASIDVPVDVVDIFRRPDAVPGIVDDAIRMGARVIWMQLGIRHPAAAARAEAAGLTVIQDRCMKIEFGRLSGELSWNGVNSRIISSRRRRLIA